MAAAYPKLPPTEMSNIQVAVCACLAGGAKTTGKIRDILFEQMGWDAGPAGPFSILRNFEQAGVIHSIPIDDSKNRVFQLTQLGLQRLSDALAFYRSAHERWGKEIESLSPDSLPPTGRTIPREKIPQRLPTPSELTRIINASPPHLALVLRFHELTECRPFDFINARIEAFDVDKFTLILEPRSTSGRLIPDRLIDLSAAARDLLQEAIAQRKSGPIFVTKRGRPWRVQELSRCFFQARKAAGVLPDVVLAGRGGWIGREFDRKQAAKRRRKGGEKQTDTYLRRC